MTFGLRNAAQTFQRLVHALFRDLDFIFPYIDDLLIASKNFDEHMRHLELVFQRLKDAGLVVNISKCVFAEKEVSFLGFDVSEKGIVPSQSRVKVISEFALPATTKGLQCFLGMVNFYRFFLPHAAETQMILYEFLKGKGKKENKPIEWSDESKIAFEKCKSDLSEVTILSYPRTNSKLSIMVDASNVALGAVVQQLNNGHWQPLSFFSRKLTDTERNYSTYDRELLAAYAAIRHFKHLVEGREFIHYFLTTSHLPFLSNKI